MTAPRDLLPMAMFALATLVGVGVVVALGDLLRRFVLFAISTLLPQDGAVRREKPSTTRGPRQEEPADPQRS